MPGDIPGADLCRTCLLLVAAAASLLGMQTTVHRIKETDGAVLKVVRLAALREAPSAFGATYEREAERPIDEWSLRAKLASTGPMRATFLAMRGDEVAGLIGAFRETESDPDVELVSMWVAPSLRSQGLARALVGAASQWARDSGAEALLLWVVETNGPARQLYESLDFVCTGQVQGRPSEPATQELRMARSLVAGQDPSTN